MAESRLLELSWLPRVENFRSELASARALIETDVTKAETDLTRLARHRIDHMMALQLQRGAKQLFDSGKCSWPSIRLAMIGSTTAAQTEPSIVAAGVRRSLRVEMKFGGFGQWRQELIVPPAELSSFAPTHLMFAQTAEDVLGAVPIGASNEEADEAVSLAVLQLAKFWELARKHYGARIVQQSFVDTSHPIFGSLDKAVAATTASLVEKLNRAVRAAAGQADVLVLDLDYWVARHGRDVWYDEALWHHAKQLVAPAASSFYGDLIVRLIAAARGSSSKCLVLDLDNTIWGGVIGDDGIDGVVLGQGNGQGEAFLAFQRYAKKLKERGVILAVCSKNELSVAEAAFRDHPEMVLKRDDIAVFMANWNDKASNLREIAKALNIGLDSLVFCDDNPVERDLVRSNCPEVMVPELPEDCVGYTRCLSDAGYFEAVAFTAEDRARAAQYQENATRATLLADATDMTAFLKSLEMKLTVSAFSERDMTRIAQLVGKTNQFNLTTRRRDRAELQALASQPGAVALSFRLVDKFGDNGLIAVLLALPDAAGRLSIDTWLMSCRVFSREVEHEAMNILVQEARNRGVKTIVGEYVASPKNVIVRDLYPSFGFAPQSETSPGGGVLSELTVADYEPRNTAIEVTVVREAVLELEGSN